uniref:Lipocalin-like domain-containing protein n=1 Tax=Solibacter usitatus (strain Ellin6076) TaxID=234267 RepID=Q01S73_SOLUE
MNRMTGLAVLAATLLAQPRPNFNGVWKLNESLSGTTASGPREIVWKIEHTDPRFKYAASGSRGYMPFTESYEFTTDGRAPADASKVAVVAVWEGEALVMRYVKDGKELARIQLRIAGGGKQMTRDGAMGSVKIHEVYDRQ